MFIRISSNPYIYTQTISTVFKDSDHFTHLETLMLDQASKN